MCAELNKNKNKLLGQRTSLHRLFRHGYSAGDGRERHVASWRTTWITTADAWRRVRNDLYKTLFEGLVTAANVLAARLSLSREIAVKTTSEKKQDDTMVRCLRFQPFITC